MKNLAVYLVMSMFSLSVFACSPKASETESPEKETAVSKINVYYFHFTRRCMTCNAVESVTKEALKQYFGEEMKIGNIVFQSINLDEDSSKAIAEKLNISGPTLLFVHGTKKIDLTKEGFMYAKNTPDKLKSEVKNAIKSLKAK